MRAEKVFVSADRLCHSGTGIETQWIGKPMKRDVEKAAEAMRTLFPPTPLQLNEHLSGRYGASIYLKREDLSPVRSYKIRGAFNFFRKVIERGGTGKTFEHEPIGGQPRGGQRRDGGASARHGNHVHALLLRRIDEAPARITDQRGSGIADKGDRKTARQVLEQLRHTLHFVVLVVRD